MLYLKVMRGVQKVQSKTVTSTMLGVFREDPRTREVRTKKYDSFIDDFDVVIQCIEIYRKKSFQIFQKNL